MDLNPADALADDPLAHTPYRAIRKLGEGGMGVVFEAEHRGLRKRVVVKLVHEELVDPRFVDRLRVEAQTLAAVTSPHVVSVTDLGETPAGRPYLVMERLYGKSLGDALEERGWFPVTEAVRICRQVLAGLSAAHRVGIVHRDVKADNVYLANALDGGPPIAKLLDFGIAKVLHTGGAERVKGPMYPTAEGTLTGSPLTISPEQARFAPVDARTDIYAVGLLCYTLVVGHGPFDYAGTLYEALHAHQSEPPVPPSIVAKQAVPPALEVAILRALAKRPEDRFQSADDFSTALARINAALSGKTQLVITPPAHAPTHAANVAAPLALEPLPMTGAMPSRPPAQPGFASPTTRATSVMPTHAVAQAIDGGGLPHAAAGNIAQALVAPPHATPSVNQVDAARTAREFVFAIAMSTVVFGVIAAVVCRYLGYL